MQQQFQIWPLAARHIMRPRARTSNVFWQIQKHLPDNALALSQGLLPGALKWPLHLRTVDLANLSFSNFGVAVVTPGMKDSPVHLVDTPGVYVCKRPANYLNTPLLPAVNAVSHPIYCSHGPSSETQSGQGMPSGYAKEQHLCQKTMRSGHADLRCLSLPLQGVMQCPLRRDRPARSIAQPVQCKHSHQFSQGNALLAVQKQMRGG